MPGANEEISTIFGLTPEMEAFVDRMRGNLAKMPAGFGPTAGHASWLAIVDTLLKQIEFLEAHIERAP